jgi:hypothetical protein
MNDKTNAVIISYYPLLKPQMLEIEAGQAITNTNVFEYLDKLPSGNATGCAWITNEQQESFPVLFYDGANEIADHLLWWCGNKPLDWFKLFVVWDDIGRYAIVLMPQLQKSVERWLWAHYLQTGIIREPDEFNYRFLFSPLCFGSGKSLVFNELKDKLPEVMPVYLVDTNSMDMEKPMAMQLEELERQSRLIGDFPLPIEQTGKAPLEDISIGPYLNGFLNNLGQPNDQ